MDINRLHQLLSQQDTPNHNDVSGLKELVEEFPYFQAAQFLLVKAFHTSYDTAYDKQLSKAAIYATDRKALKFFLEQNTFANPLVLENISPFIADVKSTDNPFVANELLPADEAVAVILPANNEQELKPHYDPDEFSEPSVFGGLAQLPADISKEDPHEIIKKRLEELFAEKNKIETQKNVGSQETFIDLHEEKIIHEAVTVSDEIIIEANENTEESTSALDKNNAEPIQVAEIINPINTDLAIETTENSASVIDEQIENKTITPIEDFEKEEMVYAIEDSILASFEKLPQLKFNEASPYSVIHYPHEAVTLPSLNFIDWLKIKSGISRSTYETVHAYDSDVFYENRVAVDENIALQVSAAETTEAKTPEKIIDTFIATAPRITPIKAEFYNPIVQAKRSIEEDDDLISETLADIYFNQALHQKALKAYQKLSLLYPEKKHFFATRILEIEKKINQTE